MFTGLVEGTGTVVAAPAGPDAPARLVITVPFALAAGESVAVNGVCLTAAVASAGELVADVLTGTLAVTTLGRLRPRDTVNLERAATLDARVGGHLVQGHVDGTAELRERRHGADGTSLLTFTTAAPLRRYLAPRGSVTLDGVSLTVAVLSADTFGIGLIPTTATHTTLGRLTAGDQVNIETDLIARHLHQLLQHNDQWHQRRYAQPDGTLLPVPGGE